MNLKTLPLVLFCLLFSVQVAFSEDTYLITGKQLDELSRQIDNLKNNNNNLILLLENQSKEFQTLESNYTERYIAMSKQRKNYQELLDRYESRNSIYKYGIGIAFVAGLILGFVVAK